MSRIEPYRTFTADPPWKCDDALPGGGRGAAKHYATMSTRDLCALVWRLPPIAPDAILFMWRLSSMQQDALDVVKAWGFRAVSEIVWEKTNEAGVPLMGMGRYARLQHETCLVAARGRAASIVQAHDVRSIFRAPRARHSEKPEAFYAIVRRLAPGPRLAVFERGQREGFDVIGDELGTRLTLPLEG